MSTIPGVTIKARELETLLKVTGVSVTMTGPGGTYTGVTNTLGNLHIFNVEEGTYDVYLTKEGWFDAWDLVTFSMTNKVVTIYMLQKDKVTSVLTIHVREAVGGDPISDVELNVRFSPPGRNVILTTDYNGDAWTDATEGEQYWIYPSHPDYARNNIGPFLMPDHDITRTLALAKVSVPSPLPGIIGEGGIPQPTSFLPDWTWKDYALVLLSFGGYLLFKDELKGGKR